MRVALCAALGAGAMLAQAAQPLQPLRQEDLMPGCGCSFTASGGKSPMLQWSWVGARQAAVRDASKVYWLDLNQERYMPEKRDPPRHGDRMVLFFADMNWRVSVVATADKVCAPRAKSCSGASYRGLLVIQNGAVKLGEVPVSGHCGC